MQIKLKDTYRSQCSHGISQEVLTTLVTLYQPLIGGDALLIYLTLASEAQNPHSQDTVQRLFTLTNIPLDVMERAFVRLEEYLLLRTYLKQGETKNSYLFILNLPLSAREFANNQFYVSRYMKSCGQGQMELSFTRTIGGSVSLQGYQDITHAVKNMQMEDFDREITYTTIKPKYRFATDDETINFDYEHFLAITSSLTFPIELRTQENMALIGKLATIYGLSAERMVILVKECVSLTTLEFDQEKLKIKAAREKADMKPGKDIYDLSPISFLQSKQHGAEVSYTDKKMIENLSLKMHFSNVVINIMVEYILNVSQNRLIQKFVDKVAGEWARDGITTKEQALLETKKQMQTFQRNKKNVKIDMPKFMKEPIETKPASKEDLEALKALQDAME